MRATSRLLALLIALLLIVPAATVMAQGDGNGNETDADDDRRQDDDLDDEDDDQDDDRADDDVDEDDDLDDERREGDEARRRVEVSRSDEGVVFELEKEDAASEEKVKIEFDTGDSELKLEFEREDEEARGNDTVESEATFEYKVELMRLVEYDDVDGDLVLSDADNVTSEVDFDDVDWSVGDVEDISAGGEDGKTVTVTADLGANGTFEMVFYAFGDFAQVNATSLRPTDVKIDFVVDGYPWEGNDTRLALDLKIEVKSEHEVESEDGGTSVNATAEDISGYFTWAPTAEVDGVETNVTSDVYEDTTKTETETETDDDGAESEAEVEREQKLTLNYERGDRIVHDPVLGVQYASVTAQNPLPFVGPLAVVAGLVLAAVFVARARKRRDA